MVIMRKYLLFIILFSGLCLGARGQSDPEIDLSGLPQQTTAKSLRYWFDTDAGSVQTTTTLSGATTIDASALVEGIHTVHYQIVDSKDIAGIPSSKMFIKLDQKVTAKSELLRYWFDTDVSSGKTTETLSGATTIDASALVEGLHTIHYQILDDQGIAGNIDSKIFIKLDPKVNAKASKLQYWFNTDKTSIVETALQEGAQTIDASKLVDGIHTLHYQIVDDKGNADIPVSAIFIKMAKKTAATPTKIRYWFNEDAANVKETALDLANLTLVIDASELPKGEHELHMQLVTEDGALTPASSGSFVSVIIRKGDANDDGKVTIADGVCIVNYLMGNPVDGFNIEAANVDGDQDEGGNPIITISDAVGVVNIILNSGSSSAPKMDIKEIKAVPE